jgi:hypothetical protein
MWWNIVRKYDEKITQHVSGKRVIFDTVNRYLFCYCMLLYKSGVPVDGGHLFINSLTYTDGELPGAYELHSATCYTETVVCGRMDIILHRKMKNFPLRVNTTSHVPSSGFYKRK